ncbi:peptide-methionine (S)-S-oxide reductase MsrA [Oceanibacterium hippocampi]|uniref:Peptide methionine sulfoxide reductase MsrA n=1 Tax=Oceanibacterium hippocampi TaxID=745714 RepID=A0A1Y5S2B1_9PROT|nr:peptide-methionine (S)-S-oxide reductase MsrA [Oceanibacterium hippocampi]SLN29645.1 Peptide methionine sulfoxide reductase MsrA [Oceanibacterium hippocampi]
MTIAIFGGGCFWGVEAAFRSIEGVQGTTVGFCGGSTSHPSYSDVCSGRTGHAEVVRIDYDPDEISYDALLDIFWNCHDPSQKNRQGPDIGPQYRSVIFCKDQDQRKAAEASRARLQASGRHGEIATSIEMASAFWVADTTHQQYFEKHGIAAGRRSF